MNLQTYIIRDLTENEFIATCLLDTSDPSHLTELNSLVISACEDHFCADFKGNFSADAQYNTEGVVSEIDCEMEMTHTDSEDDDISIRSVRANIIEMYFNGTLTKTPTTP